MLTNNNQVGARPQLLDADRGPTKSPSANVNARELARMLSLEVDAQCAIDEGKAPVRSGDDQITANGRCHHTPALITMLARSTMRHP